MPTAVGQNGRPVGRKMRDDSVRETNAQCYSTATSILKIITPPTLNCSSSACRPGSHVRLQHFQASAVVTIYTTYFSLHSVHTVFIFLTLLAMDSTDRLVFVVEKQCVFYEVASGAIRAIPVRSCT